MITYVQYLDIYSKLEVGIVKLGSCSSLLQSLSSNLNLNLQIIIWYFFSKENQIQSLPNSSELHIFRSKNIKVSESVLDTNPNSTK